MLTVIYTSVNAYTMLYLFRLVKNINAYFVFLISPVVPAFLIAFPAGLFVFKLRPFFYGALTGFVAVLGQIAMKAALIGAMPNKIAVIEYISLILFTGIAAYLGRAAKIYGATK